VARQIYKDVIRLDDTEIEETVKEEHKAVPQKTKMNYLKSLKDQKWLEYVWGEKKDFNYSTFVVRKYSGSTEEEGKDTYTMSPHGEMTAESPPNLSTISPAKISESKAEDEESKANSIPPPINIIDTSKAKTYFESPMKEPSHIFSNINPANLLSPENPRIKKA
jgi:hypothetical protein